MAFGGSRRRYPALDCADLKRILRALGFSERGNNAGSHDDWIYDHPKKGFLKVTLDCPKAPFSIDLIQSMISQAGSDRVTFYRCTRATAKKINKKPLDEAALLRARGLPEATKPDCQPE